MVSDRQNHATKTIFRFEFRVDVRFQRKLAASVVGVPQNRLFTILFQWGSIPVNAETFT